MKRVLSILALVLVANFASADGFMQVDRREWQPMAVKYHKVDVVIDNQVATTTVDEVFVNTNAVNIEATYIFPVPSGASISKLSMWINGTETEAEMLDADKARSTYEQIVRSMQDPALLEYVGARMFKLRVFPIAPGEEKRVKLSYSETIKADNDLCIYRYPLNTEKFSSKPLEECRVSVKVKSGKPLKSLMSPTHPVDVVRKNDLEGTVVYEAANVTPDKDFLLYYTTSGEDFGINMVSQREGGEDGYFMLLLSPKAEMKDTEIVKRDVCFVLDTSMSMAEEGRIEQARKAMKAGLETLNPGDRFNVINFSTETHKWKDALVEITDENKADASKFIDGLKARGGTNISEAMQLALSFNTDAARPYMVIFMTDGEPTIGETDPEKIVKVTKDANKANARIFTLGVGFDLNVNLLDRLADDNKGLHEYITPTENLEIKMAGYYEKIGSPVLSDVKLEIQGDGMDVYDVYPKQVGDVFKGAQISVFGRFKGEGSRSIKLKGMVNGKVKEFVYEASFPRQSNDHDSIPRLWAISKIGHLMDAIRLNGEKDELKKEIVALAKEFGVMTKYTSFLVLEDNARVRPGGGGRVEEALRKLGDDAKKGDKDGFERDRNEALSDAPRGASAVEKSKEAQEAREGKVMVAGKDGGVFGRRKDQSGRDRDAIQIVGGRTFIRTEDGWVDSKFVKEMETTKVEYLSDAYFKLVADNSDLGKYFALGGRVIAVSGGKAYEVVPAEEKKDPK